jgi:hypothetical protein
MFLIACPTAKEHPTHDLSRLSYSKLFWGRENGCFEYRHLCYDYCYSKILIEYHHVLADIMEPTLVVVCQRAVH